jgi:hypothetical protein
MRRRIGGKVPRVVRLNMTSIICPRKSCLKRLKASYLGNLPLNLEGNLSIKSVTYKELKHYHIQNQNNRTNNNHPTSTFR